MRASFSAFDTISQSTKPTMMQRQRAANIMKRQKEEARMTIASRRSQVGLLTAVAVVLVSASASVVDAQGKANKIEKTTLGA